MTTDDGRDSDASDRITTLPRYTQQVATDAETSRLVASMAEDPRGEWVRYGDVLAMMERSRKRIEENEHG